MFGIVGLPVPDETLLTFSGYLIYKGTFSLPLAMGAALAGSGCGITLSYFLGRTFGLGLIHRYGRYLRITEAHVEKAHDWFRRRGRCGLTIGYFVPGVRHFTAYAAGMSALEPPQFALFAYSGAVLWVSTFLTLGYVLGDQWEAALRMIHRYAVEATVAAAALAVVVLAVRWWGRRRMARQAGAGE